MKKFTKKILCVFLAATISLMAGVVSGGAEEKPQKTQKLTTM